MNLSLKIYEKDLVIHLRLGDGIKNYKNGKFIQYKSKRVEG